MRDEVVPRPGSIFGSHPGMEERRETSSPVSPPHALGIRLKEGILQEFYGRVSDTLKRERTSIEVRRRTLGSREKRGSHSEPKPP
jgi:hypothetical protein